MNKKIIALAIASAFSAASNAQTVIIGDTTTEVVNVPPSTISPVSTLILGNTASGDGTLNFSSGTLNVDHTGGYSGFVTVGNSGKGAINQSNLNGDSIINITGPHYVGPPDPMTPPDPWGGYLFLGRNDGSSGSFHLQDTGNGSMLQLNVQNDIQIGGSNVSTQPGGGFSCSLSCTGAFIHDGGTVTAGGVSIGIGAGVGTYTISSGTLTVTGAIDLGNSSAGDNRFTQNGGAVSTGGMFIANAGGSNGTYTFNDGTLNSGSYALIGLQGTGKFDQNGGTHTANDISLGYQATGTGTYNLTGGILNVGTPAGGSLTVGDAGVGNFLMTGGTINILNQDISIAGFVVGNQVGSVGTFTQSGGTVNGGNSLTIGRNGGTGIYNLNTDLVNGTTPTLTTGIIALGNVSGVGIFNQQAGTQNTTSQLYIGPQGTYNLSGGKLDVTGTSVFNSTVVGTFGSGGAFNQSGGTFNTGHMLIGGQPNGSAVYTMTDGSLNVGGQMVVGLGGDSFSPIGHLNGLFTQSGGTVTTAQILIGGYFDNSDPMNGVSFLGTGRYELSGGTVNSTFTLVGNLSQGRVLQTGGTFNAGVLQLGGAGLFSTPDGSGGFNFYSSGTYDLLAGILNTNSTTVSVFGQGTFNQSGTSEHHVAGNLIVGSQPAGIEPNSGVPRQGIYTMTGGTLDVGGYALIGAGNGVGTDPGFSGEVGAKGTFIQSGGAITIGAAVPPSGTPPVAGDLLIGQAGSQGGGTGSYQMSGGQLKVFGQLTVGDGGNTVAGSGTFLQTGGTVTANALVVGSNGGRPDVIGTYTLNGGDVIVTDLSGGGGVTYIGGFAAGTMTQNGGSLTSNFINVGILRDSHGTYTLTNGTVTANFNMGIGGDGTGSFVQIGGQVSVNSTDFGLFIGGGNSPFTTPGSTGTYTLSAGSLNVVNTVFVGNDGVGTFNQSGGAVVVGANNGTSVAGKQDLYLGLNAIGNGTYNLSGGTLEVWGNSASNNSSITVGGAGTGLFVQTGGSVLAHGTNSLAIGDCCGGSGEYRISAGSLTTTGNAYVGAHEQGTMQQTGGAVAIGGDLLIGLTDNAVGQYTMNASAGNGAPTLNVSGSMHVGFSDQNGGATGKVDQSAGTTTVAGGVTLGSNVGGTGTYNLSGTGSQLNVTGNLIVGGTGTGHFTATGTSGVQAADFVVAQLSGSTGDASISGNAMLNTGGLFARLTVGASGNGTFAQSGSSTVNTGGLFIGAGSTSTSSYTMNGGTLNVLSTAGVTGGTRVGAQGTGTFTLNSGTHNTTFMEIGGATFGQGSGGSGTYQLNGGNLVATGTITVREAVAGAAGILNVAGGALTAPSIVNNDRVNYSAGSIAANVTNNANFNVLGGGGGTRTLTGSITNAATGTITVAAASPFAVTGTLTNSGTVNLSSAAQANVLAQTGGTLNLGSNNLSVTKDYTNTGSGTGNNFNARAGVTGTGQIIGVNASETILGATAAGANTWTLNFGNVRGGGSTTLNYQIANNGTGADIRGAIQTGAPGGGNITDTRLSGTGVPTGGANFGAIAAGSNSGNLAVTFNSTTGGGSLTGQSIAIVSNFGNIATQTINLVGTASQLAVGNATPGSPPTVNLGNFRVGAAQPKPTQDFSVQNTASGTTSTTERLGIGSAATTGNFTATNNLGSGFINPGASQAAAVTATVSSGGVAGINNGSVNIQYTTNGTLIDPTFTTMNANSQSINVTATGYNIATGNATPSPTITLGAFHVGQAGGLAPQSQNIAVANTAAATFSEQLGVGSAGVTGAFTLTNNIGASLVNAGATFNNALNVARNGGVAGANSGTISIQYTSDGTNTSGLSAINSNQQSIGVQSTGYNLATAGVTPNPVTVANQRVGGTNTAALTIANTAPVNPTFTETLSASFANANTGNATNNGGSVTGIVGGGSNNTSMRVAVDTSSAGARTGTVTVNAASNEVNSSGLGNTALTPQVVTVNGNVYQVAAGAIQTPAFNFGTVQVGQSVSQNLTIRNTATGPNGFVEDLNAAFGTSTDARIIGSGSLNGILAGTNSVAGNGTMTVSINTAAAGTVNGSIHVNYASAGAVAAVSNGLGTLAVGGEDYSASGTIQANVIDTAKPIINGVANPGAVNVAFGNLRIGSGANQQLTVQNQATGNQQAALNASIASDGAPITASGSFSQLLPGNSSPGQPGIGTLQVGISAAASAGHIAGSATVSLVSDASNVGGCSPNCAFNLPSQTVNVTGDVYRLANPLVNTPSPITLNARVGDTSPSASISIGNSSPDQFTEGLNVTRGSTPAGFSSSGSITNLAAQGTSNAISVSLNTGAAGHVGGTQVLQFASNGTITNNADLALANGGIQLSGNVYQAAAGAIQTPAFNFGTVQVGQSVSQNLTIRNTASGPNGFVEDLNAGFGGSTDARIVGTGSLNGILAGTNSAASNGTMTVSINTASAGTVNGSIHVNYASAGAVAGVSNGLGTLAVGGEDYAASGTIQANVVDQAKPVINGVANPGAVNVNLGNLRIGSSANQTLTVQNQATGNQQAALNASIASNGAPITASGSFSQLLPGNSSPGQPGIGTLQVGISAAAPAGHNTGSATVSLVSDASNIGGCAPNCAMSLPSQTVNVAADVYRLANPLVNTASPINLAGRVGGVGDTTHLTSAISISNSSPDQFTEGLNVTRGSTPSGFSSSGSITNLAAQGTSNAISVSLNTAAAGHVGGTQVLQFASNGTITNNADLALANGGITLSGNVYTPAVAQVTSTTPLNLGIVHVGDAAPTANVTVKNNAAVTALNDTLQMSFASATGPFTGSGTLTNLGAQQSNSSSLTVGMNTTTAGAYSGHATFNASSHDSELADLNLPSVDVDLVGQVNNYALAAFRENSGGGSFSGGGASYVLDFGNLIQNSGHRLANLGVFNNVLGPSDILAGAFQFLDPMDFGETGFSPFSGLSAGQGYDLLNLDFNTAVLGTFQDQIRLTWSGSNASGYQGPNNEILLTLRANVVQQGGSVPEPTSISLMLLCLTALAFTTSRGCRATQLRGVRRT